MPYHRVPIGDGGAAGISEGSGALHSGISLVWSSGKYVMGIGTDTLGPKSQFSRPQGTSTRLQRRLTRPHEARMCRSSWTCPGRAEWRRPIGVVWALSQASA